MLLQSVNLNSLIVFQQVYRTQSMTKAAAELNLTQSGVSQHIRKLEEFLGHELFVRANRKLYPSPAAEELNQRVDKAMGLIEEGLNESLAPSEGVRGTLRIGAPIEFGTHFVVPALAKLAEQHPNLRFELKWRMATDISDLLLRGDLDIGFADQIHVDSQLTREKVAQEEIVLCGHKAYIKKFPGEHNMDWFRERHYITYGPNAPVLRKFFADTMGESKASLHIRSVAQNVQGIRAMVLAQAGLGVLPVSATKIKDLVVLETKKQSSNDISIVYAQERKDSPLIVLALEHLKNKELYR